MGMQKQNDRYEQYQEPEQDKLQPVEEMLLQENYPAHIIENYPKLLKKDMHLAEIYRLGTNSQQDSSDSDKNIPINPFQVRIDRKGQVWVDVLLQREKGVKLKELKKIMKIRGLPGRGKYISGRVNIKNLPQLLKKSIQLQAARTVYPTLYKSVPAIQADSDTLSTLQLPTVPDGHGVIVGIVDIDGCDFNHPSFKKNSQTRLLYLWDQNGKGGPGKSSPHKYSYGVEYDQDRINQALGTANPYDDLDYTPLAKAHGTHVMGIAAGNHVAAENPPTYPGVAPAADLIFVHIGKPTDPKEVELGSFGSSHYLFDAVNYIFEKAKKLGKPAVVNISMAANGGSHDGTSPVEAHFDEMLEHNGRAIVISAGNTYGDHIHIAGEVTSGEPYDIKWQIQNTENAKWDFRQELEIWYNQNAKLKIKIIDPTGTSYGTCRLGETQSTTAPHSSSQLLLVRHLRPDAVPGEDENHINIFIDIGNDSDLLGAWTLQISHDGPVSENNEKITFHAWVEYNGDTQSHFRIDTTQPNYTLNAIGNGELPLVIGSYDAYSGSLETSKFSSAGPSRNKKYTDKPELCAPGEHIYSANAMSKGGILSGTLKQGTSMGAPHVTGVIALMFQVAKERQVSPKTLKMKEIRDILIISADPQPQPGINNSFDPQSGFGRLNALRALSKTK
jgi:subtilisin family serine protease